MARNFNDKLRRELKKHPENRNILPQFWNEQTGQFESRITIQMLKESIATRRDYNRNINMLKRFSKRGATEIVELPSQYGAKTTKWQKAETIRLTSIVNRRRQERLEKLNAVEMMDASGKLGYTLGQRFGMNLASRNKLSPTKSFTVGQSQKDIQYKMRGLLKETQSSYYNMRDRMLKENYIRAIQENYGSKLDDVVNKIRTMNDELFVLKFEARGDKFEMIYSPDSEQGKAYASELRSYWLNDSNLLELSSTLASTIITKQV